MSELKLPNTAQHGSEDVSSSAPGTAGGELGGVADAQVQSDLQVPIESPVNGDPGAQPQQQEGYTLSDADKATIEAGYNQKHEARQRAAGRAFGALALSKTVAVTSAFLPPTLQAIAWGVSAATGAYGGQQFRKSKSLKKEVDTIHNLYGGGTTA